MFFTFSRYGQVHLEVASDLGHQFVFQVVPRGQSLRVKILGNIWRAEKRPENAFKLL